MVATRLAHHQLHRLPVIDAEGRPLGMVSIGDLARAGATPRGAADGSAARVARTLAAVKQPRALAVQPVEPAEPVPVATTVATAAARRTTHQPQR